MYHLSFLFDFIHMSSADGGGKIKPYIFKEGILLSFCKLFSTFITR